MSSSDDLTSLTKLIKIFSHQYFLALNPHVIWSFEQAANAGHNRLYIFLYFMFLYILRVLLMLAESRFWRVLFAGTQNNHKPIMGYFGHGSGRLLN